MGGGVGCLLMSVFEMDLLRGLVFLRQTGFSVILASLEAFDFGLLGEDMMI